MKFVIYGPHYDDNSGGIIALYKLCRLLTELNHEAKIWHWTRWHPHESRVINGKFSNYFDYSPGIKVDDDPHNFIYDNASPDDVGDSIVVYPEIVEGNPLGGRRVVRWLLNKPGAINGSSAFGVDELTFFFSENFLPDGWKADPQKKLKIFDWKTDTYRRTNHGERRGVSYMVRKGAGLPLVHHPADAMRVDNLSHTELAAIFNRCRTFISYDAFNTYAIYAALCGCDSVVIPQPTLSLNGWREAFPFGVAYGFDDIDRARQTRPLMVSDIENTDAENFKMVSNFVSVCRSHFWSDSSGR